MLIGVALKPRHCLDLMLYAQTGKYQHTMERKQILVRRIPDELAYPLANILNERLPFEPILFAGKIVEHDPVWKVFASEDKQKNLIPGFCDIKCKFKPSASLKAISTNEGLVEDAKKYKDIMPPYELQPAELGFAPYALALYNIQDDQKKAVMDMFTRKYRTNKAIEKLDLPFKGSWVYFLDAHLDFWANNKEARDYAYDDVVYLQKLFKLWGQPELDDDNSVLACCVASARMKGYNADLTKLRALKEKNKGVISSLELNLQKFIGKDTDEILFTKPSICIPYIQEKMDDVQKVLMGKKSNKILLEALSETGTESGYRAGEILGARQAAKLISLIDKLSHIIFCS